MPRTSGPGLVAWAVAKLALDFPASFPDATTAKARDLALRELLAEHQWVSPAVFERAVYLVRWKHPGPFLPTPAVFLDFCQAAADDLERQRREQSQKLPPPAPPTEDERRAEEDRVEAAKLRARLSLPPNLRKARPQRRYR